jgi:hypothetical protein
MKKILMSLMVICLAGGLIGAGLFADFSDIETSRTNFFSTGSLDLKVSDTLGNLYDDPNVPTFFEISNAYPCCSKDIHLDLHNVGQGWQQIPDVYLHIKNLECFGIEKNEPELAAETGATPIGEDANGTPIWATVDRLEGSAAALGEYGENCELSKHVDITIARKYEGEAVFTELNLIAMGYDKNGDGIVKMDEVVCEQILLGILGDDPNTSGIDESIMYLDITLHLQDVDEDDLIADGTLVDPGTGYGWFDDGIPAEAKWDHWPTNALQKDIMYFDMAFELLQT